MEPEDVRDEASLGAYLDGLPEDQGRVVALRVASNAALRVLPVAARQLLTAEWARTLELTPLAVFGACLVSAAKGQRHTDWFSGSGARGAADAVAARMQDDYSMRAVDSASNAAFPSEVEAIGIDAQSALDSALGAAVTAEFAASSLDLWPLVRRDLNDETVSIWPEGTPQAMEGIWAEAVAAMRVDKADWSFWIAWYERVLAGKDWHPEEMVPILNGITAEDWDKGPGHINKMFEDVLALYRAEDVRDLIAATPIGAEIDLDVETATLSLRPTDQIEDAYVSTILGQIDSAIRLFHGDARNNAYQPLSEEIGILSDARNLHADRPVLLLKDISRVLRRLDRKIEVGDCPPPKLDANIDDFRVILEESRLELVALSPEVRAYHEATRPEVVEEVAPVVADAAQIIAGAADSSLATALNEAAYLLMAPGTDPDTRRFMQYWIVGVVARSYRAAKVLMSEAADVVKKIKSVSEGLAWLLGPSFSIWVTTVVRDLLR